MEDIRWSHNIWPETNPRPKPLRSEIISEAEIRTKVENSLRQEAALEGRYGVQISNRMLQLELNRMAANSRVPDRLEELFNILEHDPVTIAECLARPALVRRLLRNHYQWDKQEHQAVRIMAAAGAGNFPDAADANKHILELLLADQRGAIHPPEEQDIASIELDSSRFARESGRLAHKEGNPGLHETSTALVYEKVLQQGPARIRLLRQVWKKRDFDTWWQTEASNWSVRTGTQAASDLVIPLTVPSGRSKAVSWDPRAVLAADSWRVPDHPVERYRHSAVWTGTEMIVWGGRGDDFLNTGGRYDPVTDTWTATSIAGAPSPREGHTAIWTGSEMIVWGGMDGSAYIAAPVTGKAHLPAPLKALDDGGRYDPLTDTWTTMVASPVALSEHTAVWSGDVMIVWGGRTASGDLTNAGGRYNPSTNTWAGISSLGLPGVRYRHSAVWSGNKMIIWGGENDTQTTLSDGGGYDPVNNNWAAMSDASIALQKHTAVWTGTAMIVWGGIDGTSTTNQGSIYDPFTDNWTATSTSGAPLARTTHTAIWTGNRMVVWGGSGAGVNSSGGIYDPATDQWSATSTANAPSARNLHTMIWTGSEMIVWGGWEMLEDYQSRTGGRYDPASDSWQSTPAKWSPRERSGHTAVWTGNEMIIWGGVEWNELDSGGRYDPVTDIWTPTSLIDVPAARKEHTAVWTGSEMLVWGGYSFNGSGIYHQDGSRYSPATDSWQAITLAAAPPGRYWHTAIWSGNEMIIWGGWDGSNYLGDGGRYDPATDSWSPVSAGPLAARIFHSGIWTGTRMLIWGGYYYDTDFVYLQTGAQYNPLTDSWSPVSTASAPSARGFHSAIWTGQGMIVWGGQINNGSGYQYLRTGGRYDPAADTWYAMSTGNAPSGRIRHSAVWTGNYGEMIVWGGEESNTLGDLSHTGGRYDPLSNTWTPTSTDAAPGPRALHSAIWTGREMIVWGGLDTTYSPQQSMGVYYPYGSYRISGNLAGLAAGSSVVLQNNQGDDLRVTANGSFVFDTELLDGSRYDVTILTQPDSPKRICSVNNGSGMISGADITTIGVSCVDLFADVDVAHWAYDWIQALGAAGITQGCGGGNYCPADNVSRAEMAVFLERGMNGEAYTPPAASGHVFTDVPLGYWAADWIEQLAADGITSGCGGGNYCPDSEVTRAEMAVFLLRSEHGSSYTPPPATGNDFDDVPVVYWASGWIEQLAEEGITQGCGGNNYCPDTQVTRAEMAVFLVRVFNL
jgi:N-acetylneuraminic acid mutarotase